MKKIFFSSVCFVFLLACNGDTTIKNNVSDPNDTSGNVKKEVTLIIPKRDSFALDENQSSFACTRSKTVKDVEKQVKIFGGTMNLKMDNASFSANTSIKIKNGWWFLLDKKSDGGKVILDMKSVAALQIGKEDEIETGNPEYLETKKYPTATLTIIRFDSIPGNEKKLNVIANLQIKDTTGAITFPAKIEYLNASQPAVPSKLTGDFSIDGIKWALNPKNAKVLKDDLAFHVVLVTEKKK
ncbi:MAG: YceI family protein [Bacteroidetes bacterium]|nr:YceI family protein [Bacteroidota bacterium]